MARLRCAARRVVVNDALFFDNIGLPLACASG